MPPADPRLLSTVQDSCARVLLFRGGDKELKNYNSQTPFQVQRAVSRRRAGAGEACAPCSGRWCCWTRRPRSEAAAPNLRLRAPEPLACPGPVHSGPCPVRPKGVRRQRLLGWGGQGRGRLPPAAAGN